MIVIRLCILSIGSFATYLTLLPQNGDYQCSINMAMSMYNTDSQCLPLFIINRNSIICTKISYINQFENNLTSPKMFDHKNTTWKPFEVLHDIFTAFQPCEPYSIPPLPLLATISPDSILFNRKLAMYSTYLNEKAVLRIVDAATDFQNDLFIRSKSTEDL